MMRSMLLVLWAGALGLAAEPGPLVIVGGGDMPKAIRERFIALAGGDTAKIVVIPTASEYADKPAEAEAFVAPWKKLTRGTVTLVHTRDRKVADSEEFAKQFEGATGVWFGGGDQAKVTAAYLGTKTETAIKSVHARGGVLGGTSAGAALMSNPMITGGNPVATFDKGFGFLPGVITDQHFLKRNRQPRLIGILEKHPGMVGMGVDESTAAVVSGRQLEVIGESSVTLMLSAGAGKERWETALRAGDTADLDELRRDAVVRAGKVPVTDAMPAADCQPSTQGRRWWRLLRRR
jgi:cyanophycinase